MEISELWKKLKNSIIFTKSPKNCKKKRVSETEDPSQNGSKLYLLLSSHSTIEQSSNQPNCN